MTKNTQAKKRFNRFFVIILIVAVATALLTFATTHIAKQKQRMQDSQKTEVDTTKNH